MDQQLHIPAPIVATEAQKERFERIMEYLYQDFEAALQKAIFFARDESIDLCFRESCLQTFCDQCLRPENRQALAYAAVVAKEMDQAGCESARMYFQKAMYYLEQAISEVAEIVYFKATSAKRTLALESDRESEAALVMKYNRQGIAPTDYDSDQVGNKTTYRRFRGGKLAAKYLEDQADIDNLETYQEERGMIIDHRLEAFQAMGEALPPLSIDERDHILLEFLANGEVVNYLSEIIRKIIEKLRETPDWEPITIKLPDLTAVLMQKAKYGKVFHSTEDFLVQLFQIEIPKVIESTLNQPLRVGHLDMDVPKPYNPTHSAEYKLTYAKVR